MTQSDASASNGSGHSHDDPIDDHALAQDMDPSETAALDEFDDDSLALDESANDADLDDAELVVGGEFNDDVADGDPDVQAIDKAMSKTASTAGRDIRRLLEERSEARQLKQDLDYLDFDD